MDCSVLETKPPTSDRQRAPLEPQGFLDGLSRIDRAQTFDETPHGIPPERAKPFTPGIVGQASQPFFERFPQTPRPPTGLLPPSSHGRIPKGSGAFNLAVIAPGHPGRGGFRVQTGVA